MVLVGARTTFSARTNFFFIYTKKKIQNKNYLKQNYFKNNYLKKKNFKTSKTKVFIYIKNPVWVSLLVEFLVLKTP